MRIGKWMMAGLMALMAIQMCSAQTLFTDIMARYVWDMKDRYMYDVWVKLELNDSSRQLTVRSKERPLNLKYEDVREIILDPTTLYIYLEYRKPDGGSESYMFSVERKIWDEAVAKFKSSFGDRVSEASSLVGTKVDKSALEKPRESFSVKADKANRPMGEIKSDKALIVLVARPYHYRTRNMKHIFRLQANNQIIAAYKQNTYVFVYLDPGEYVLTSEANDSSALNLKVEAGKGYYLLQDTTVGGKAKLSTHPKQVVLYELEGTNYADWKKKK